jgi:hypothetical protein
VPLPGKYLARNKGDEAVAWDRELGGVGGDVQIVTGNGGASSGTAANSNAGNFKITLGSAGAGASGAAERRATRLSLAELVSSSAHQQVELRELEPSMGPSCMLMRSR